MLPAFTFGQDQDGHALELQLIGKAERLLLRPAQRGLGLRDYHRNFYLILLRHLFREMASAYVDVWQVRRGRVGRDLSPLQAEAAKKR